MDSESVILSFVQQHWRRNRPDQLGRGVWVAWREPIEPGERRATTAVCKAWFMTERTIERRPATSFKVFAENRLVVSARDSHEMGEANIAPFRQSDLVYLELLMAPLHGVGMRVAIEDGRVIDRGALWST